VLLRRTMEAPPHGQVGRAGIDLHLGQNPKLGGRYANDSLIYISYFVGSLYIHVLLSLLFLFLFLLSKTQKDQKYFYCFSLFVSSAFYLRFALLANFGLVFENPKIFCFVHYFLSLLFQKSKTPKIFVVLLRFCKACCRVQSLLPHWSLVFTLYYSSHTSEKAIMTTYDNPRCGKRLV
jgi:hypothetical protein